MKEDNPSPKYFKQDKVVVLDGGVSFLT